MSKSFRKQGSRILNILWLDIMYSNGVGCYSILKSGYKKQKYDTKVFLFYIRFKYESLWLYIHEPSTHVGSNFWVYSHGQFGCN